jgi:hypothetical protein
MHRPEYCKLLPGKLHADSSDTVGYVGAHYEFEAGNVD